MAGVTDAFIPLSTKTAAAKRSAHRALCALILQLHIMIWRTRPCLKTRLEHASRRRAELFSRETRPVGIAARGYPSLFRQNLVLCHT